MPGIKLALHWQILIALCLAVLTGLVFNAHSQLAGVSLMPVLDFLVVYFLMR